MSRYIDADVLIKDVRKRPYIDKYLSEVFETIIDEQPTAYDVEKVVEEVQNVHLPLASQKARIIGIIRKGGVE